MGKIFPLSEMDEFAAHQWDAPTQVGIYLDIWPDVTPNFSESHVKNPASAVRMQQKWVISIIWHYDFQFTVQTEKIREGHTENCRPGRNRSHQQQGAVLTALNLHPKVVISLWLQCCCRSSYSENRGWWTPSCKILVKNMNKIIYFTSVCMVSMYLHGQRSTIHNS